MAYGAREAASVCWPIAFPAHAFIVADDHATVMIPVEEITIGSVVMVRHGEVLPLDGELLSERALVDESSLTGEPYVLEKAHGDEVRSGTVNQSPPLTLRVGRESWP